MRKTHILNKLIPLFNMGPDINSPGLESRPHVSVEGKFLFFTSHRPESKSQDIYWVDIKVIENIRSEK